MPEVEVCYRCGERVEWSESVEAYYRVDTPTAQGGRICRARDDDDSGHRMQHRVLDPADAGSVERFLDGAPF